VRTRQVVAPKGKRTSELLPAKEQGCWRVSLKKIFVAWHRKQKKQLNRGVKERETASGYRSLGTWSKSGVRGGAAVGEGETPVEVEKSSRRL